MTRRRSKTTSPDGGATLDADRGSSSISAKSGVFVSLQEQARREDDRAGLRDLDARLEATQGLTRAQRDRDRLFPRETNAAVRHPRMERTLPDDSAIRKPFSGRQMKARSSTKRETIRHLTGAQRRALAEFVADDSPNWTRINDQLSDSASDVDAMEQADRTYVKRLDRAIQAYESRNDRGHVVYANVDMPSYINHTSLRSFVADEFQHGDQIAFDRFTGTSHSLHNLDDGISPGGRTAVFEIQTRRGMYLGQSDGGELDGHLLPRGLLLEVESTGAVTYQRPDGTHGERLVVQLKDITPEPSKEGTA